MQRPIAMSTPNLAPRRKLSGVVQFAVILGLVLLAKVVAAEAFYVPSGSMQPTLLIGDELVVSKFAYGYSRYSLPIALGPSRPARLLGRLPGRGDVVVFQLPRDPAQAYVKRVVGLPGDQVQMRNGRLWINGKILPLRRDGFGEVEAQDGSIIRGARYIETLPGGREHPLFKLTWSGDLDDTAVFKVATGHVFVMGDNRDDSADS